MAGKRNRPVEAEGKKYSSVKEFCDAYGLKYTTAVQYIRDGKTGDEVLQLMGTLSSSPRIKNGGQRTCSCVVDGVNYVSLSAAAEAYGIPVHVVYSIKHTHCSSAEEAIHLALDKVAAKEEWDRYIESRKRPVIVEGVRYPTKAAAAMAYGIPMATLESRMQRYGVTFEEAVCMGKRERRHIVPEYSLWKKASLKPIGERQCGNLSESLMEIAEILRKNTYRISFFYDKENDIGAVRIKESLFSISAYRDIFILTKKEDSFTHIEFVIPELLYLSENGTDQELHILSEINRLNKEYTWVKIGLSDQTVSTSWMCCFVQSYINARVIMRVLNRMLGSSAAVYNSLQGVEGSGQVSVPAAGRQHPKRSV